MITNAITDPESGVAYTLQTTFHDKDIEVELFDKDVLKANVMIEAYNGTCQVVITDQYSVEHMSGENPKLVKLLDDNK